MDIGTQLEATKTFIRKQTNLVPEIGIILGSGLGHLAGNIKDAVSISYKDIPYFVPSTVQGHFGKLFFGELAGRNVVVMQGRLHFHEGYSMQEITYPVRLMKYLGAQSMIVTAAVGAMNPRYQRGDVVFIKDHINLMGSNPLRGSRYPESAERFPDMSRIYAKELRQQGLHVAKKDAIRAHEGIYVGLSGPCYETPAEIRAFRKLGGDVVGMSVIPEATVGHVLGMKIAAITYISNLAAGVSKTPLSHEEVLQVGSLVNHKLGLLIAKLIPSLPK